jgi:hypothetical protein
MLEIYAKNDKENLTLPELNELRKIVAEWSTE